jgi:hypothetical protein
MTLRARMVPVVALALLLAGCGGRSYKTVSVSGRVTLDNKPLPNAKLTFVPAGGAAGDKDPLPSSDGTTDAQGHYTLALTRDRTTSGAVVAKHKVIIYISEAAGADDTKPTFHKNLPPKYNRNTVLECDVPEGGNEDANFTLTSK